ncbi:MAG: hypothetical protein AABW93_00855 [Nanoarchaeota archaeon]
MEFPPYEIPYEVKTIKERLSNMPLPVDDRFDSAEEVKGYLYDASYTATVGRFDTGKLKGLVWVISIGGSETSVSKALETFVKEIGNEPIDKLEMPGPAKEESLIIYFWKPPVQ